MTLNERFQEVIGKQAVALITLQAQLELAMDAVQKLQAENTALKAGANGSPPPAPPEDATLPS